MTEWEYTSENVAPGESWYDMLRKMGSQGWEAWHIEKNEQGWREIYFKRPRPPGQQHLIETSETQNSEATSKAI